MESPEENRDQTEGDEDKEETPSDNKPTVFFELYNLDHVRNISNVS